MHHQTNYSYDPFKLDCLEATISPERLKAYLAKAAYDRTEALELYLWNTALSQALYGPLQALEISLRNVLNRELCSKYGLEWYKKYKAYFVPDKSGRAPY